MNRNAIWTYWLVTLGAVAILCAAAAAAKATEVGDAAATTGSATTVSTPFDSTLARNLSSDRMALDRDADGGTLPSLTIEAEDQISVRFERPRITLDLQPRTAPGLDWETTWEQVDLIPVVRNFSALETSPYLGRPWLNTFITDQVVVFQPRAESADRWKLSIVDSRGRTAMTYAGKGEPPHTIAWDGRRTDGSAAWPGLIYTHVLETRDRAGNERTFTGEGFELPPFRLMEKNGVQLVFAGDRIAQREARNAAPVDGSEMLFAEMASWLNQMPGIERPIRIRVTARSRSQARRLAEHAADMLSGMVVGPDDRLVTEIQVVADAPDPGMIVIATR